MPVQDATAANAALWSNYLQNEWSLLSGLPGQRYAAETVAASISASLTLLGIAQITWLYELNAAAVSQFIADQRTRLERPVIPEDFRAEQPHHHVLDEITPVEGTVSFDAAAASGAR